MVIFGVETEKDGLAEKFMLQSHSNLQKKDIVVNPFAGKIIKLKHPSHNNTYVVVMDPVYPRVYILGLLMLAAAFVIRGFQITPWMIPGTIISIPILLYSKHFYYLMLVKGIRKFGYRGKISVLSNNDTLDRLITTVL